jgi:hypothetical protein
VDELPNHPDHRHMTTAAALRAVVSGQFDDFPPISIHPNMKVPLQIQFLGLLLKSRAQGKVVQC